MAMMYSYTTMTLRDVIKNNPNLFENMNMSTPQRTQNFIDRFKAMYNNNSIGAETVQLFKYWIEDKFNEVVPYYEQRLSIYEKELDGDDGKKITREIHESNDASTHGNSGTSGGSNSSITTTNYDLPRTSTPTEKPTTKTTEVSDVTNGSSTNYLSEGEGSRDLSETIKGDVNVIEQREKWLKFIRDIYSDMCKEFRDCFAIIYA